MLDLDATGTGLAAAGMLALGGGKEDDWPLLNSNVNEGRKFVTAILSRVTSMSVDLKTRSCNRGLTQRRRNAAADCSVSFMNAWPSKGTCLLCVTNGLRRELPPAGDDCME
jgi:hypothetical protein